MIYAKNYESASTFVKVIQRKLLASFLRTRCIRLVAQLVVAQLFCRSDVCTPINTAVHSTTA